MVPPQVTHVAAEIHDFESVLGENRPLKNVVSHWRS
jgi:hypothetical protein